MIEHIILGAVQGLTEFFPVSSSGHLVIFQKAFGGSSPGIATEVFLHTGTLLAVVVLFRRDIVNIILGFLSTFGILGRYLKYRKVAWYLIIANIPAGVAGVLFKSQIESIFSSQSVVFVSLIVTGLFLFIGKYFKGGKYSMDNMGIWKTLVIGLSQAAAIIPGISRSGITITTGIFNGLKRSEAARFSFLMMVPAVGGATFLELSELSSQTVISFELLAGVLASFVVGYIALKTLISIVKNYKLHYFAYYCVALGVLGLYFF